MSENKISEDNLKEEFRKLGKNLADTARAAWDNPERKKLQQEIEEGLSEMRGSLSREYEHFRQSPAAQRLKKDVQDIGERVRNSEIEGKIRNELIIALHQVNIELENLTTRWSDSSDVDPHPDDTSDPADEDK